MVAAAGMALMGPELRAGQVPIVILGVALVPFTYLVGVDPSRLADVGGLKTVDGEPFDLATLQAFDLTIDNLSHTLAFNLF